MKIRRLFFIAHFFLFSLLSKADLIIPDPLPSCKGFKIYNSLDASSALGFGVFGGGDINDDKVPDIIVANYKHPSPSTIYVIYGTKTGYTDIDVGTMTSSQGFRITGVLTKSADNANFLSSVGDVDGDGIADLVIGAAGESSGAGVVYVVYGKKGGYTDFDVSSLTSSKGFKIIGSGAFGASVDTRADFNGDGIADIIIGARQSYSNAGSATVIYGQKARDPDLTVSSMAATRGFIITGNPSGFYGASAGSVGDFNGDDYDDFVFAGPADLSNLGKAYVIYGQKADYSTGAVSSIDPTKNFIFQGASPIIKIGRSVSPGGDFNNDKISDFMIASTDPYSSAGAVFVIYGSKGDPSDLATSGITNDRGFEIKGVNANDYLGSALSSIEDINGDGITEIMIGARNYNSGIGAIYIIYGREDQPSSIDLPTLATSGQGVVISTSVSGGSLGTSMRDLGDINQDGVPDMIIGASGTGLAYVLFGQSFWSCNTCETFSTCKKCNSGYDYIFNGVCYVKCPKDAPYYEGFACYTEDPHPITTTLKDGVSRGATATASTNSVLNLWSPADALPFIYGQLKTSIIYMRYLNISRTNKLEELFQLYVDSDTNVIPFVSMSDSIKDAFPIEHLPYMFQKYSLPSSFISNFGDDLLGLVIIFGLFLITKLAYFLMNKYIRNLPTVRIILNRVHITLQNFFIGSFAESLGITIFYASLEFRNSNPEEQFYTLSPFICSLSLFFGLSIVVFFGWILYQFQVIRNTKSSDKTKKFEKLEKKYEGIAVLFGEFESSSLFTQSAFLIFSMKSVLESIVISLLFKHPFAQAILLFLLTSLLLIYIILKRPLKSKIDLSQQLVLILLLFICNVCLVIMAMAGTDLNSSNFQTLKENTSNVIFWNLVLFQFVPLLFFTINLIAGAWELYKLFTLHNSTTHKKEIHIQKPPKLTPNNSDQSYLSALDQIESSRDRLQIQQPSYRARNQGAIDRGSSLPRSFSPQRINIKPSGNEAYEYQVKKRKTVRGYEY